MPRKKSDTETGSDVNSSSQIKKTKMKNEKISINPTDNNILPILEEIIKPESAEIKPVEVNKKCRMPPKVEKDQEIKFSFNTDEKSKRTEEDKVKKIEELKQKIAEETKEFRENDNGDDDDENDYNNRVISDLEKNLMIIRLIKENNDLAQTIKDMTKFIIFKLALRQE